MCENIQFQRDEESGDWLEANGPEVPSVHISGFASISCATSNLSEERLNECKKKNNNKETEKKQKKKKRTMDCTIYKFQVFGFILF